MRVLLALGQIAFTFAPALVILMTMAFDGEAHRGKGSDLDSLFFLLAVTVAGAVVVVGLWLTWSSRSVSPFSLRFWAPSAIAAAATIAVFGLLFLSQLHAARSRYAERKAQMTEMRAELGAGDVHRVCELVALSTRDNLTQTTLTVAREDEVRACLAHARSLAPEKRRAALDAAFLLAGRFLAIDAEKAGRPAADWSRSFPPFPASTQADIVREYFTTRLSLPPGPAPADAGDLTELLVNVRALRDWDASAQEAFANDLRPQLLARVEAALRTPDPDTVFVLRRLRAVLVAFPGEPPAEVAE